MTPEAWAVQYLRQEGSVEDDGDDGYWVETSSGAERNIAKHAIVEFADKQAETALRKAEEARLYMVGRKAQQ